MQIKHAIMTITAAAVAGLSFSACADFAEEFNDAPVSGNLDTPALRVTFPDGFGNVAMKCAGPDMIYSGRVTAEGRALAVSPGHSLCEDGVLSKEEIVGAD